MTKFGDFCGWNFIDFRRRFFFSRKSRNFLFFKIYLVKWRKFAPSLPPQKNRCMVHKIQKEVEWDVEGKQTSLKWRAKRCPKMQQRGEHRTPPVWNQLRVSEWECCSVVAETSVKRTWTECTLATPHAFRAFFNFLRFFSVLYSLVKIDLSSLLTFFYRPRNHFLFTQHFVLSSGCLFLLGDRVEGAEFSLLLDLSFGCYCEESLILSVSR